MRNEARMCTTDNPRKWKEGKLFIENMIVYIEKS